MIRVGPAGWAYKDWAGIVYPHPKPRGFDPLSYLAEYFDTIEINSSFYGPPKPSTAKKWIESIRANPQFRFTAKLFESFTHARTPAPMDERDFKDGIAPLLESSRLGALLVQFPWSFKNDTDSREYLVALCRSFREYPLVVEVRHSSWVDPAVLDLLGEMGVGICNIDQPIFHRSIKPDALVTSTVGYVRLHGRNYKQWFSPTANVRDRYDHLYSTDELAPWLDRIKQIARDATETYVVANNHNIGKGPVNALEIRALLEGTCVPAPPTLLAHYAELRDVLDELPGAKRLLMS